MFSVELVNIHEFYCALGVDLTDKNWNKFIIIVSNDS